MSEITGDFAKMDDAFWKTLAIKNFHLMSAFSPKLQAFSAWGDAIESVKDKVKLAEGIEVEKGTHIRIDKVLSKDRAMLVVQLSQE